ncbi:hypothetical protein ElyMa_005769600 [Elysia marginata]|uniref:N-acetyltransferase domain-containing protein n=1 Tax=Elysia marginata TaxID=1093978 RepID=A0AAV4FQM7_9GAST|nr:hypothetical protein ElyMa_005769600 [Elysia marginata]
MWWTPTLVNSLAARRWMSLTSRCGHTSRFCSMPYSARLDGRAGRSTAVTLSSYQPQNFQPHRSLSVNAPDISTHGLGRTLSGYFPSSILSKQFLTGPSNCHYHQAPRSLSTYRYSARPRTAAINDKVQIRRAVLSDYQAVVSLADIGDGQDYLYALFNDFVTEENTYPLVATMDDVVVGLYMVSLFDGGRSIMRRAARVHEHFRGTGVYRRLEEELENYVRDHHPHVETMAICKNEKDDCFAGRFSAQGYTQSYRRPGTQMIVRDSKVKRVPVPGEALEVRQLSGDELRILFRSEQIESRVFPDGRLLNFYLSYRPLEENVQHLICERGGAFVSFERQVKNERIETTCDVTVQAPVSRSGHEHHRQTVSGISSPPHPDVSSTVSQQKLHPATIQDVAMVTFYYYYPTAAKPCYFLDAYARLDLQSPVNHFRAHLHHHLNTLQRVFPNQDAILPLTFESTMTRSEIMCSLHEVGIVEEQPNVEQWQVLYERQQ